MAHNNTVLAQFLKLVPRHEFERDAAQHHKGRKLRKMTRWNQFEPPRESRRLHSLSLWEESADEITGKILPGSPGTGGALGVGSPGGT